MIQIGDSDRVIQVSNSVRVTFMPNLEITGTAATVFFKGGSDFLGIDNFLVQMIFRHMYAFCPDL